MARRRYAVTRTIVLCSLAAVLLMFLGSALFLGHFRLLTEANQTASGDFKRFYSYWPRSPLVEVQEERKRLKKFPQQEQRRRLGIASRRMEFVNGTIVDLDGEPSVSIEPTASIDRTYRGFEWPVLPPLGEANAIFRYVYAPVRGGSVLRRGAYLRAGEELRFSAEMSRDLRHLIFYVLPLGTGQLRGVLGKYTFVNSFEAADAQLTKRVSISIGDATATQFRLRSVTGEFFILFPRVSRFEQTGRIPVQLASEDTRWSADTQVKADLPEDDAAKQSSHSVSAPSGGLQDPFEVMHNEVREVSGSTVAFGYNVLIIRKPATSTDFTKGLVHADQFRKKAWSTPLTPGALELHDQMTRTIPEVLRSYGYHTVAFTGDGLRDSSADAEERDPGAVALPWLGADDAALEEKNLAIAQQEKPAKGLDAIFQIQEGRRIAVLGASEMARVRAAQDLTYRSDETLAKSAFHEVFLLKRQNFLANLLTSYHSWSSDQWQTRFYQFVDLAGGEVSQALQNLLLGLRVEPSLTLSPRLWGPISKDIMVEQAFNFLLESLQARRLTHRTIVVVIEQRGGADPSQNAQQALVYVPGLAARRSGSQQMSRGSTAQGSMNTTMFAQQLLAMVGASPEDAVRESLTNHAQTYNTFRMTVLPLSKQCGRLRWFSHSPVARLRWQHLKLVGANGTRYFDFYPCSAQIPATIEWDERVDAVSGDDALSLEQEGRVTSGRWGRLVSADGHLDAASEGKRHYAFFSGPRLLSPAEEFMTLTLGAAPSVITESPVFIEKPEDMLRKRVAAMPLAEQENLLFAVLLERSNGEERRQ